MKATLTNKRKQPNMNGAYTVTATCDGCGHRHLLSFSGWSAIVCQGCKAEIERGEYRKAGR